MSVYTNIRRLEQGKQVQYLNPNDPKLFFGKTAWRQDACGPVECILVFLDGVRTFIEKSRYIESRRTKVIEGKTVSSGRPVRRKPPTNSRLLRTSWAHWKGLL